MSKENIKICRNIESCREFSSNEESNRESPGRGSQRAVEARNLAASAHFSSSIPWPVTAEMA